MVMWGKGLLVLELMIRVQWREVLRVGLVNKVLWNALSVLLRLLMLLLLLVLMGGVLCDV